MPCHYTRPNDTVNKVKKYPDPASWSAKNLTIISPGAESRPYPALNPSSIIALPGPQGGGFSSNFRFVI